MKNLVSDLKCKCFYIVPNKFIVLDKFINFKLLGFLGAYSLEIYLLHEKILWILAFSEKTIVIDKYHIVINIIAYLWSNIVLNLIIHIFNNKYFSFSLKNIE